MVSALLIITFYSAILFVATFVTTSLPLLVHMSKGMSKAISLIGAGLMLGTAFIVVVPEAVLNGCECPSVAGAAADHAAHADHLESKNIGLAIAFGFLSMMVADSISHGDHESHDHDCNHGNEFESDMGKEEVIVNMSDSNLKKLRSSITGLCLHSLFDGIVIGSGLTSSNPTIVQTMFWAIFLHKISASLGVGIFIRQLHIPFNQASKSIILFSAVTPVSTVLSALLMQISSSFIPHSLLGYAFAVSAGTFLHVALMHMLPSVGHHIGLTQVFFILVGIFIPYLLFMDHGH